MSALVLLLTVFVASAVEAVEALTIVLAAGVSRDWRSALTGVACALGVLAVVVGALGPLLRLVPIDTLRLVIGGLLLVFGLQWLRKAILRAAGLKARHDETSAYDHELEAASAAPSTSRAGVRDWSGFTLAFKGSLLEGMEVVFIVVTLGASQHGRYGWAALGAALAVLAVASLGFAVRAPLARVPENTMKFAVGVMLTAFGTFWATEGSGTRWPGGDLALVVVVPAILAGALGAVALLRATLPARPALAVGAGEGP